MNKQGQKDKRRRRRVMEKFRIDEISAVDRPAQESALSLILKRRDGSYSRRNGRKVKRAPDDIEKQAMITSMDEGHSHLVIIDFEMGDGARPAGDTEYARGSNDDFGHSHPWIMDSDGNIMIGMAQGHTHEQGEFSVTGQEASRLLMEKAADSGGGNQQTEDTDMSADAKKAAQGDDAAKKLQDDLSAMQKRAEKAEAIAKMDDPTKVYYNSLIESEQETFLAKSETDQQAEILSKKQDDPVVYKSADGTEFRKSDDPRLVAMAKRADEADKRANEEYEKRAEQDLRKRAEDELTAFPGSVETRMAIIKAVDGISDEAIRNEARNALKAQNARFAPAFSSVGTQQISKSLESGDANAQLDELAKKHAAAEKVDYYTAYEAVSKAHPDLYAKAVQG